MKFFNYLNLFIIGLIPSLSSSCGDNISKSENKTEEKEKYTISGQVFVVQKNRINVKLGGVPIIYIDGPTLDLRLDWIAKNINKAAALQNHLIELQKIDFLLDENRTRFLEFSQQEFLNSLRRFKEIQIARIANDEALLELMRIFDLQIDAPDRSNREAWMISAIFGEWMQRHNIMNTTTDADGNFTMSIPKNSRGFLLAQSSRSVTSDTTEEYQWLYELAQSVTTPVHLNSLNTLESQQIAVLADSFRESKTYTIDQLCEDYSLASLSWIKEIDAIISEIKKHQNTLSRNKDRIQELEDKILDIQTLSPP